MTPAAATRRDVAEALRFAVSALVAHKTRTLLTGLSMLIANASVIAVVSVALAGRDFVVKQIEGVGSNLVYAYYEAGGNVSAAEADYINLADIEAVRDRLGDLVDAAAGVIGDWDWVAIEGRPQQIRILGSSEDYREVRNLRILAGRFFDAADVDSRNKVALLTPQLAADLYGGPERAVGRAIKVHGLNFRIIGVFEEGVETFGQSEVAGSTVLIPVSVIRYFQPVERVDPLYISVRSQQDVPRAQELIRQTLESRHRPGSLYRVQSLTAVLEAAEQISSALTVVLVLVAALTLSISGIFIMNIMLIAVAERTKEIGVRMAVGATRRQIKLQFLMEAVGISLLGGLAGVVVGVSVPLLARRLLPEMGVPELAGLTIPISTVSIVAAIVVSGTVGAVFGLLPAARASELHPVEALRYE